MELKIINPQDSGFVKEIEWNHEELKAEIAAKMQDYKTLAFTEDTIKEAKADRANLNKLKKAFDDERKRIKKLCMAPYDRFEQQAKEIIALIDEPIQIIDAQIKEVEEAKKIQKRKDIEDLFGTVGFQTFVTLDMVWDEKWLNATVPMSKIEEQMKSRMYQIGDDVATIHTLPEFSFEAMEIYKKTLDLSKAIQEGQRLADIQKRKAAYEEEQRRKQEEAEAARKAQEAEALPEPEETPVLAVPEEPENVSANQPSVEPEQPLIQLDFRVWGTKDQLMALRQYMVENNLRFGKVE